MGEEVMSNTPNLEALVRGIFKGLQEATPEKRAEMQASLAELRDNSPLAGPKLSDAERKRLAACPQAKELRKRLKFDD
jgi:hypothetical protein